MVTSPLKFALILLLCLFPIQGQAQSLNDAVELLSTDPEKAYTIAANTRIDTNSNTADYERYLKLFIILNARTLHGKSLGDAVRPFIGLPLKTSIKMGNEVSYKPREAAFFITGLNDKGLFFTIKGNDEFQQYDQNDYLLFSGNLRSIQEVEAGYTIVIDQGQQILAAGPSIISRKENETLISTMNSEDWPKARKLASELMHRYYIDPEGNQALLRYMFLYALAGEVTTGALSYDALSDSIKELIGEPLLTRARKFSTDKGTGGGLNVLSLNDSGVIFTTTTNREGTYIHFFEYLKLEEPVNTSELNGKRIRTMGIIEAIETNPNKSRVWIMRVRMKHGQIEVVE